MSNQITNRNNSITNLLHKSYMADKIIQLKRSSSSHHQSMDAIRRNLWSRKETNALLRIFKERNVVSLLMRKSNSPVKIFTMVESQMAGRGFTQKSTLQIMRKWKKLKSTYSVKYRPKSGIIDETKIPYFKEIHELMTSRMIANDLPDCSADDIDDLFALNGTDIDALPATLSAVQQNCRDDERRNLWNNEETIAMLEIVRDYNVASQLKCMRKGNMEVYAMVANKMAERQFVRKNSSQIRIKWKRLKSSYNKHRQGKAQDVIRSEEVLRLLQHILANGDFEDDDDQQMTNGGLAEMTDGNEVYQPEFRFEAVAILNEGTVNLMPADGNTIPTHHIITTNGSQTSDLITTHDAFDTAHIYTTATPASTQTDKLMAAIPSGIVDTNDVNLDASAFASDAHLYDDHQAFLQSHTTTHNIQESSIDSGNTSAAATPFTTKELQDDYFRQKRQLIAYKYEMKAEMQKKAYDHMLNEAKRLFNDIRNDLFDGIREIMDNSRTS